LFYFPQTKVMELKREFLGILIIIVQYVFSSD
jgi:hypothetical protein